MKKLLTVLLCIFLGIGIILGGFAIANEINKISMNKYIDSFSAVDVENRLTPEYEEDGTPYFVTDGDFRVMHLTDVHITGGVLAAKQDKMAINAVAAMITAEKPDLVIVTGDISFAVPWSGTLNNKYAHDYFARLMERLGVYWTITLGNHDSEAYNYFGREKVAEWYENDALTHCLFSAGPKELYGSCNHTVNVKNSKGLITRSFVMIDTNSYTDEDPLGINWIYDNIHADQIKWYEDRITEYTEYNEAIIASLPESERPENATPKSMLFCHIPIKEVRTSYNEYLKNGDTDEIKYISGIIGEEEEPYIFSSEIEEEMFETMVKLGSTQAMFYGHDHLNNLVIEYCGITLSYGYSIDYFAYSGIDKQGAQRGCSVITCSPDGSFTLTHENYYQDKYQPLYEKEQVDLTK